MQKQILVYLLGMAFLVICVHCGVPLARAKRTTTTCSAASQQTFQTGILNEHNKWRAAHCVPAIEVDPHLTTQAQNYAAHIASIDTLVHSGNGSVGENLYWAWSSNKMTSVDATAMVDSWYNEVKQYNFGSPGFSSTTGHFTQVVWKGTTAMGCGFAFTSDCQSVYGVCQYTPPGNYLNNFPDNVHPATC